MTDSPGSDTKARVYLPLWLLIICHVLLAAGGGALVFAHFRNPAILTWPLVIVAAFTLLPALLPVIGFYVGEVQGAKFNQISIQGAQGSKYVEEAPSLEVPAPSTTRQLPPTRLPASREDISTALLEKVLTEAPGADGLQLLSADELKVLRTLWKFQTELMGGSPTRRWGFRVSADQHDFKQFERGVRDLLSKQLIEPDRRELVFLSDRGMEFCRRHDQQIRYGEIWARFQAA